jgi:4-amino-4-deoxy-L-arabinose transferase-like glycosyltransferase
MGGERSASKGPASRIIHSLVKPSNGSSAPGLEPSTLFWLWAAGFGARAVFAWFEPKTSPVADETMWLMSLSRIPEARFSPFSNYPIFHPPLYPYFLAAAHAPFGSLFAIKLLQAFLGSLLVPAVIRLTDRAFGGRAAIVAGTIAALYPEFIWYASHFWCETIFLTLLWWAVERVLAADAGRSTRTAAIAGFLFGLAILTRETLLYLLPIAALWLGSAREEKGKARAAALVTAAFLVVAPWTVRNWIQFHAFIPVSTGGGLNLYQGNAPISRTEVYNEYDAKEGKVEQFQWARAAGLKVIWDRQPAWLFEKIRDEGPRLFEVDSLALIHARRGAYGRVDCASYRSAAVVILLPWIVLALATVVGLSRMKWTRERTFLVVLAFAYLLLHIATHGFSRYRLPVVPAFIVLGASLANHTDGRRRGPFRWFLLAALAVSLMLLWAPSVLDQLGHLGFAPPPAYEGFAPVCPAG